MRGIHYINEKNAEELNREDREVLVLVVSSLDDDILRINKKSKHLMEIVHSYQYGL